MKPWVMPHALTALLLAQCLSASAQPTNAWRVFTHADGLASTACESVTLGGGGNVLVRHADTNVISILDGYEVTIIPGPEDVRERVYQSPGGQLWTVGTGGLQEFRDGAWFLHPIREVQRQQNNGTTNEISLRPVQQGFVFILLNDQLLAFRAGDSPDRRLEVMLRAETLPIGQFRSLVSGVDRGIWLVGTRGCAKREAPLRHLRPGQEWEVFTETPEELVLRGGMLDAARQEIRVPGVDGTVDPDGGLWVASAAGLFRRGPALWEAGKEGGRRLPEPEPGLSSILAGLDEAIDGEVANGNWSAGLQARNGDLWLGGAAQIAWRQRGGWRVFSSTNHIGPENVVGFAEAPDGRICCSTEDKVWEFDGRSWLTLRGGFDRINSICFSRSGALWVGSDSGVHRYSHQAWSLNDSRDGLPSNVVRRVLEDDQGQIVAITAEGPSVLVRQADSDPPRTFIRRPPEEIGVVREGDPVRIAFSGRDKWDVTRPEHLLYSYRIDDREWSAFEAHQEALFAALPVGAHYFQVRAMDRNANIDPLPARLEFNVALPWYREIRIVVILAGASVVSICLAAVALNRHRRLRLSYAEVERKVAQRSRALELAQRELLHSQKMNALGNLTAGIAHDFNNILSIVKGSAQLIEEDPANGEKNRARLDRIRTVVDQGSGIVNAMLGFSGNSDEQPTRCQLNAVVEATIRLLGERFVRTVEVRFEPGADLPEVVIIRNFVQQILLNLIFNAAESMRDRKVVTLRTKVLHDLPSGVLLSPPSATCYVSIEVGDVGCGIDRDAISRIFEPFFTTKAFSTKRGTGLGLSMVHELAKKLDAGLAVESVLGEGSTFTLILPATDRS